MAKKGPNIHSLDILGKPTRVTWDADALDEDTCGKTDPPQSWIRVKPSLPPVQLADTLLHEAMHCIYYEMGLADDIPDSLEEAIVRRMATGTLYVLRHNPALVKLIMRQHDA